MGITSQIWFWFILIGGILIFVGVAIYAFFKFNLLIPVFIGAIGTVAVIIGVILMSTRGRKREPTLEEKFGKDVRLKVERIVPKIGKVVERGNERSFRIITSVGLSGSTILNKFLAGVIDKGFSAVLRIKRIVYLAIIGLLLSWSGIGEGVWVAEIAEVLGSLGGEGLATAGSGALSLGSSVLGGGGSTIASLGGNIGSLLTSTGSSSLGTVGSSLTSVSSNVGVNLGLGIAEQIGQAGFTEGTNYLSKGVQYGTDYLTKKLQAPKPVAGSGIK